MRLGLALTHNAVGWHSLVSTWLRRHGKSCKVTPEAELNRFSSNSWQTLNKKNKKMKRMKRMQQNSAAWLRKSEVCAVENADNARGLRREAVQTLGHITDCIDWFLLSTPQTMNKSHKHKSHKQGRVLLVTRNSSVAQTFCLISRVLYLHRSSKQLPCSQNGTNMKISKLSKQ